MKRYFGLITIAVLLIVPLLSLGCGVRTSVTEITDRVETLEEKVETLEQQIEILMAVE